MRKLPLFPALLFLIASSTSAQVPNAWINEFHYDNTDTDVHEFVEVALEAASGIALSDLVVALYNSDQGTPYNAKRLDRFTEGQKKGDFAFYTYTFPALQNGPDGLALSYQDTLVQFLCYEGTFTATDGPASGHTCTDIGRAESNATPENFSVQLAGAGLAYPSFGWSGPSAATPGQINAGQLFNTVVSLADTSATRSETDGSLTLQLTLHNPSDTAATLVEVTLLSGEADDLGGFTTATVTFPPGSVAQQLVVPISDDALLESVERFVLGLENARGGDAVLIGAPQRFTLSLRDDEMPNAWINEIHYENIGSDIGEFVEVIVEDTAGIDLSSLVVTLYDGHDGTAYQAQSFSPMDENITTGSSELDFMTFIWRTAEIQNGPDGLALSYQDTLVQFLCYEGTFTATDGPASGHTCTDIGRAESNNTTLEGTSLQLTGIGRTYEALRWQGPTPASGGQVNAGQVFNTVVSLADTSATRSETDGSLTLQLTLHNPSDTAATHIDVRLFSGEADDLGGFTTATVTFAPGSGAAQLLVPLSDDALLESVETFVFGLENARGGDAVLIGTPHRFTLTLQDDDVPNVWINEVDADQPGVDSLEYIELTGEAGLDISGYILAFYSGADGSLYRTQTVGPFVFHNEGQGYGFYVAGSDDIPERDETLGDGGKNLIQNGPTEGIALFDPSYNLVFQYAYGSAFTGFATALFPEVRFFPRHADTDGTTTTMGFLGGVRPADTDAGTDTLLATPGTVNTDGFALQSLPVELISFTALADGDAVVLRWETASEKNNAGFEIQRREGARFTTLGFVAGLGTTAAAQRYHYRAAHLAPGRHVFRLRQVDFDGAEAFSPETEIMLGLQGAYELGPAYPNPFNPEATFSLTVQRRQRVSVEVFNLLGRRVGVLFEGIIEGNSPRVFTFEAADLPSGLYLYHVRGETFIDGGRVTLLK